MFPFGGYYGNRGGGWHPNANTPRFSQAPSFVYTTFNPVLATHNVVRPGGNVSNFIFNSSASVNVNVCAPSTSSQFYDQLPPAPPQRAINQRRLYPQIERGRSSYSQRGGVRFPPNAYTPRFLRAPSFVYTTFNPVLATHAVVRPVGNIANFFFNGSASVNVNVRATSTSSQFYEQLPPAPPQRTLNQRRLYPQIEGGRSCSCQSCQQQENYGEVDDSPNPLSTPESDDPLVTLPLSQNDYEPSSQEDVSAEGHSSCEIIELSSTPLQKEDQTEASSQEDVSAEGHYSSCEIVELSSTPIQEEDQTEASSQEDAVAAEVPVAFENDEIYAFLKGEGQEAEDADTDYLPTELINFL